MSLLKNANNSVLVKEDAAGGAVSAGDIAGGAFAMPLFTSLVQRNMPPKAKIIKYGRKKPVVKNSLGIKEAYYHLSEGDPTTATGSFDTTNVIAKLKGLETKEKTDPRDTVVFGLEDDDGGLVKVTVKNDQAADFEKSLQAYMSSADKDGEVPEIAEMLFDLKDRFDIVDVEFPEVEEDAESSQEIQPSGTDEGSAGEESGAEPGAEMGDELSQDLGAEGPEGLDMGGAEMGGGEDTEKVSSLLASLIDAMKQDAIAKKKEAEVELARIGMQQAESRVKQEEEMMDMDVYNKAKKSETAEAKRLAQLAKFKQEMNGEDENDLEDMYAPPQKSQGVVAPEEEETSMRRPQPLPKQSPKKGSTIRGRVHPHDIAQFILNRVK